MIGVGREGGGGENKEEEGGRGNLDIWSCYMNRKFTTVKVIVLFLPNVISTNFLKDLVPPKKILARSL